MKYNNIKILLLLFCCVFLGCDSDYLENTPTDKYSDENVWSDENLTNLFLNGIYKNMPAEYDRSGGWLIAAITDEAESARSFHASHSINRLQYDANSSWVTPHTVLDFATIRKCNLLIHKMSESTFDDDVKTKMIGQAKFLRAYLNMNTYMLIGRFPIIDKPLTLDDELAIPRGTDEACIAFMKKDFDDAALVLPEQWGGDDIGRATKGACYALKARLLLNIKDYEGAAAECEKVFKLGYELFPNYLTMFNPENDNNSEVIFDKQYGTHQSGHTHDLDLYESSTFFSGFSSGINCPTQNLVDAFEMTDGKEWDESPLYDAKNPYDNRDPRLYATVMHDGIQWQGQSIDMKKGSFFNPSRRPSATGYYLRKFLNPNYNFSTYSQPQYQNSVIIRLADVYLMYAECMFVDDSETAREYVNKVRRRVSMPDILAVDFTFESIMQERKVELAFEGQRWHDAIRWEKGDEIIGALIYGVVITDDPVEGRTYERVLVEDRVWDDKMELFPYPQSEFERYPEGVLEQNPGW